MIVDADTLHCAVANPHLWSRANFEEAMPGVLTPMSWSFWGVASEASSRRIYTDKLGAFAPGELTDALADSTAVLFFGRAAVNVDLLRRVLDRMPGADPNALEAQILGQPRALASNATWRRAPQVLAHAPLNVARGPRRLRALRRDVDAWWRLRTRGQPPTTAAAGQLLVEARDRFADVTTEHGFNVFVGQAGFDQLRRMAAEAGHPGLELALSASGRGTEETAMLDDLWAAARGARSVEEIVATYGYHGPVEGEMSSASWREDRAPLLSLLERFRAAGGPAANDVATIRAAAEQSLLAGLGRPARIKARAVMRFVDTYLPLREVGKTSMLQCIDVGRHAAHAAGRLLAADGRLEDPADVQFATVEEIVAGTVDATCIAERRRRRAELLALEIPDTWVGVPESWPVAGAEVDADPVVRGLAASGGRYKGVARLIASPEECDRIDPGDVLVCEMTDPGWAPVFGLAGALVVDIGGPLSHGAIVAREMGIPCVIGTGDGTRRIPDGAVVEVDGDRGEVVMC